MNNSDDAQEHCKQSFLDPRSTYYGEFTPQQLVFNSNLQEFAQRVGYICALETGGKITALEAYESIKQAWNELHHSKAGLDIGKQHPPAGDY